MPLVHDLICEGDLYITKSQDQNSRYQGTIAFNDPTGNTYTSMTVDNAALGYNFGFLTINTVGMSGVRYKMLNTGSWQYQYMQNKGLTTNGVTVTCPGYNSGINETPISTSITLTRGANTYNNMIYCKGANGSNERSVIRIGRDTFTCNNIFFGFENVGDGSQDNKAIFGYRGSGSTDYQTVTIDCRGNVNIINSTRIGGTGTANYTLDVLGDINTTGNYRINGNTVVTTDTLGSSIINSSLQNVGNNLTVGQSVNITSPTGTYMINGIPIAGLTGIVGSTGPTGTVGVTGIQGPTGKQGIDGNATLTGSTGTIGSTGPTGDIGAEGTTGYTGPYGYTGLQGFTGTTGCTGEIGSTGPYGYTGLQGFIGSTGCTGVQGPSVYNGFFYDDTTQTNVSTVNYVSCSTTVISSGITITNGNTFNIQNSGTYDIEATLYFFYENGDPYADLWLEVNGNPVINSRNTFSADNTKQAQYQFTYGFSAGDTFKIAWFSENSAIELKYGIPDTTPTRPAIASAIVAIEGGSTMTQATIIGPTGSIGVTGQIGYTGSIGYTGCTGIQGTTGVTGSIGAGGTTGVTGYTGIQGPTGVTGSIGAGGTTGPTGVTGSKGDKGDFGAGLTDDAGYLYMYENVTATTISVVETRYSVSGTATLDTNVKNFSFQSTGNCLVYNGSGGTFHITATLSMISSSSNVLGAYIAVHHGASALTPNLDVFEQSESNVTMNNGTPRPVEAVCQMIYPLVNGDRIYVAIENNSATNNITVEYMSLIVAPVFSGLGSTGPTGIRGITGYTGLQGQTGVTGIQGTTGPSGTVGASLTGVTGPRGFTGYTGISYTGPTGPTGIIGPTGIRGITGAGYTGSIGPTGSLGSAVYWNASYWVVYYSSWTQETTDSIMKGKTATVSQSPAGGWSNTYGGYVVPYSGVYNISFTFRTLDQGELATNAFRPAIMNPANSSFTYLYNSESNLYMLPCDYIGRHMCTYTTTAYVTQGYCILAYPYDNTIGWTEFECSGHLVGT